MRERGVALIDAAPHQSVNAHDFWTARTWRSRRPTVPSVRRETPDLSAAPERGRFHGVSDTRPGESQDSTIERAFDSDSAHQRWAIEAPPVDDAHCEPGGVSIQTSTSRHVRTSIIDTPELFRCQGDQNRAHGSLKAQDGRALSNARQAADRQTAEQHGDADEHGHRDPRVQEAEALDAGGGERLIQVERRPDHDPGLEDLR